MENNAACKTVGMGTIKIKMFYGIVRTLADARYVPELKKNLISLGALDSNGCSFNTTGGIMKVKKGSMVVMKGEKKVGNLYHLIGNTIIGGAAVTSCDDEDDATVLWHKRLGHMSERGLQKLHNRKLLKGIKSCRLNFCKFCVLGKQHRVSFKLSSRRSKGILEYVHADAWGPASVVSMGGAKYFGSFIDDFSRKVWEWKIEVEKQTGKEVKCLRTDNGGEFTGRKFKDFCKNEGIVHHFTTPGTPQQNGVAERMSRTLLERARCMRLLAELPKVFWAEAVNTACYVIYRSPSTAIELKTPEEVELENTKGKKICVQPYSDGDGSSSSQVELHGDDGRDSIELEFDVSSGGVQDAQVQEMGTGDPSTFSEAMKVDDSDVWLHAMKKEMESLLKNQTRELVELPKRKRAIGYK
ncbi:hypothetical protein H6P81_016173 [Aristolochia fimbriata]|uniref:Integrase catalytic domain-containing protein n=1 Tax=Aristolochia fimbriata TaxID=158543 RepID=A0AAV7E7N5_ARIFI|nr:hypothetical protein H6P81_016173 [Aristolochia fimbriata]